ncbi:MAG: MotA/TolQ/ExbB proton channel family protein [Gammaproteobacteria bacterium]|nr:MotA/TolQ/ExbB proton channel family protein [Gammaproteobacteria bacterium]MBU2056599.1 MotA/TolQ/ExbB proton channel family protein [Gammaproteobacteria bacterium]MBU2173936.1 MotA/TolQ/ExbB proton channel family protein [Gammaproteobacteria bacterium]MBU2247242.1 MotA/TolQ/ExbB proton channel family protein [Gammaproteobacteria bacterium]MBU2344900.1 MotA/TolQ/ExbB proton channel family protein [Gammaproteobacteria bacterium]
MHSLIELWESVRDFIATGGDVLYIVAIVLFIMWVLIIERFWFISREYPVLRNKIIADWDARVDTTSWYAHKIRDAWVSEASSKLNDRINVIKTLVAICPMVGLLGTVTGMIAVFEIMAVQGTGNPRLMAAGISMATIPTMAGMVACLSGVFVTSKLEGKVKSAVHELADSMPHH